MNRGVSIIFHTVLEDVEVSNKIIKYREAVRAIIFQNDKILLVQTNKGDFKFPGGGIKKNETHVEALSREIREETGYTQTLMTEKFGLVVQRRNDIFEKDKVFQMNSHYYFCQLKNEVQSLQQLDDYELKQEFTPVWVSLTEAIEQNKNAVNLPYHNGWVNRETIVLKEIERVIKRKD